MITLDNVSVEFSKILNEVKKKKKTPKESKRKRQKIILLTIKEK